MKSGTERKGEGLIDQATGKAKEVAGDVLDDPGLHREGKVEHAKGKLKERAGNLQTEADRLIDAAGDETRE
jgi:uncharacterized protein YjbJ (UPF0337 family)